MSLMFVTSDRDANGEIGYERNDAQRRDTRDTDDEQAKI